MKAYVREIKHLQRNNKAPASLIPGAKVNIPSKQGRPKRRVVIPGFNTPADSQSGGAGAKVFEIVKSDALSQ